MITRRNWMQGGTAAVAAFVAGLVGHEVEASPHFLRPYTERHWPKPGQSLIAELQIGDIVRLNSGGPEMLVVARYGGQKLEHIDCEWVDAERWKHFGRFRVETVTFEDSALLRLARD